MNNPTELTLEQQFQLRLMQASAHNLSAEQARELLIQATRLVMLKENAIKSLREKL